jgi:hypothetical protein
MNRRNTATAYLKRLIQHVPVLGSTARRFAQFSVFAGARRRAFPGSAAFWENRYREGGTSGSGSYGKMAEFKAEILNEFVRTQAIQTVIEFGCGDGAQLELARYPEYVGVDVATVPIERCSARFEKDPTKRFYLSSTLPGDLGVFDLALSLEVIFHLVEDSVFDSYMSSLFARSRRYVVIFSSNYDALTDGAHVRHRKFTDWTEKNARVWKATAVVPNRFPFDPARPDETSFSDFHFFARQAG